MTARDANRADGLVSTEEESSEVRPLVLIVDDDEDYLDMLTDNLRGAEFSTVRCSDPRKAIELAAERGPDILLIDLVMPQLEGVELCRQIRADSRFAPAVLVLMTAKVEPSGRSEAIVRGLEAGADDFLIKPFGTTEMIARLRACLRLKRFRDGPDAVARKRTEEALAVSEAKLGGLLSCLADLVFVFDKDGRFSSYHSPPGELYFRPEDFLGKKHSEVMPADLNKQFAEACSRNQRGESAEYDYRLDVGGETRWYAVKLSPLCREGVFAGSVAVLRDITKRKREKEALRESEERYRRLFEQASDAIFIRAGDDSLANANPEACRLLGCAREELLAMRWVDLHPEDAREAAARSLEDLGREPRLRFESRLLRADGSIITAEVSASLADPEEKTVQMIVRDITARKRLQEEQQLYAEQVEQEAQRAREYAEAILRMSGPHRMLLGNGTAYESILKFVGYAAPVSAPVLLLGESGTGKEVAARAIHHNSPRAAEPFVVLDCTTLTAPLLESALFGHQQGAFTGATREKRGLVEIADGGTLFVDEIGDMPLELQSSLLRVLERGEFRRVGSVEDSEVDLRVIAATNRELAEEMKAGRFRKDLYYRLNVLTFAMPLLRDRREDIHLFARHFLAHSRVAAAASKRFTREALALLETYEWPGNIRELANVVERAVILAGPKTALQPSHLPPEVRAAPGSPERGQQAKSLAQAEKETIEAALAATGGNRSKAAKILGTSRMTLRKMMNKHGISVLKH